MRSFSVEWFASKAWANPLETYKKLAALSGFTSSFLVSKRISFPGKIHKDATNCIVSFPGKYGQQWDDAVFLVKENSTCSMACVFLTEKESGLGEHADNPEAPGECWCKALYGQVPAQAYLSVLDHSQEVLSPEDVATREADAAAMGQIIVVKHQQMSMFQWHTEFAQARKDAEERCEKNLGRSGAVGLPLVRRVAKERGAGNSMGADPSRLLLRRQSWYGQALLGAAF
ncbi:unnamed protein product [Symbiodinium natans]|uniref:Uncharacterized protein n=1 Tax=Symbiodinium natans TaxID=878477 RepID=A0A812U2B2_9DINO|nr:unnamed protein product [Symbiodinium natans]